MSNQETKVKLILDICEPNPPRDYDNRFFMFDNSLQLFT